MKCCRFKESRQAVQTFTKYKFRLKAKNNRIQYLNLQHRWREWHPCRRLIWESYSLPLYKHTLAALVLAGRDQSAFSCTAAVDTSAWRSSCSSINRCKNKQIYHVYVKWKFTIAGIHKIILLIIFNNFTFGLQFNYYLYCYLQALLQEHWATYPH